MSSMEDSLLTPTKDSEELEDYSEQDRLQESDSTPTPKRRCLREMQEESAFDLSTLSLTPEEDSCLKQEESTFDLSQSPNHSLTPEDSCLKQEKESDDGFSQKDATDLEKEQQEPTLQTPTQSLQDTPKPSLRKTEGCSKIADTGLTESHYTPKRTRQYETKVLMTSSSTNTESDGESEYFPTPQRKFKIKLPALSDIPNKCSIAELRQVDSFIQNFSRGCKRKGCRGGLIPVEARTQKMGGAARIIYRCKICSKYYTFDSTILPDHPTTRQSKLSRALQVAFITAGCTHATYRKVLDILGMVAVSFETFMQTIRSMHPVVEEMVKEMCTREKNRMKDMNQEELGSWTRAVTSADGTWQTRGHHSKNSTFTVRNFFNGGLLYCKHLCHKGRDHIIEEPLYKGTSKSAEGYSATLLMNEARTEGLNIEVHWQDGDSSSSKRVSAVYPRAIIMMCGGHAAKSHLKLLMVRGKQKKFTAALVKREEKNFPEVADVECHCKSKPCKAGCKCLTNVFCQRARNSFSNILSTCESASDFSRRLSHLIHHVQDEHQWEEENTCEKHYLTICKECEFESDGTVARRCDFHPLTLCNCGECADKEQHECEGKLYRTKEVLSCPFHLLAYRIECATRTKMADNLVHPILKRGHSNWLESSHNVLIRFRPKHIFLERLHYIVSTNLGLLQANMTHEYEQQGADYHWKPELYKRLNLPVYEGVQEVLSKQNQQRKTMLDVFKTEKIKRRRVQLKKLRVIDGQQRILWTGEHGQDTYGKSDKAKNTASRRLCPKNKKPRAKKQSKDQDTDNDGQGSSNDSDQSDNTSEELYIEMFEDDVISGCECSALGRAHTRVCPMNPRNYEREKNPKQATSKPEHTPHSLPTRPYLNLSSTFGDVHDCVPAEHDVVTPDGDAHVRINDSPMTDVECSDSDHYTYQLPDEHDVATPDGAAHVRINDPDEHDVVTVMHTSDSPMTDVECSDSVPDEQDVTTPDGAAHARINDSLLAETYQLPDEHDVTPEDDVISGCNCKTTAHKRDCPMNPRNKHRNKQRALLDKDGKSKKKVFPGSKKLQTSKAKKHSGKSNFKAGDTVYAHIPGRHGQHLICRIAQVNCNRFIIYCTRGKLAKRFGESELSPTDVATGPPIMKRWRQSKALDIRKLLDEDLVSCSCKIETPEYQYVSDNEEDSMMDQQHLPEVKTLLYTLKKTDMDTVRRPYAWLNDNVIAASQEIVAQQFPHIEGLQPTTLQQIQGAGGFKCHGGEFVQILNVSNCHWCVVSTVRCQPGHINVYDTMYRTVQESTIQIIARLVDCTLPSLTITMVDVGKQSNSSDCGVLAIAIAYDLCAGNDPSIVVYEHTDIRQHLLTSLENCSMDRFPVRRARSKIRRKGHTKEVPIHCFCRVPYEDNPENPWVKCTSCGSLFHIACASVPDTLSPWKCNSCT